MIRTEEGAEYVEEKMIKEKVEKDKRKNLALHLFFFFLVIKFDIAKF